jgi:gliding motility-associated lipoprotein GldB
MKRILISFCIAVLFLTSCQKAGRFEIDTTKNRVEVKIHRFDKDLINLDTVHLAASIDKLYKNYPAFIPVFCNEVLDTNYMDTVAIRKLFVKYLTDTTFTPVNKKTLVIFENVTSIESKVSDAYTYIHYYFPKVKLPEIYFFVSGFNRQVILNERFIALGSDMYLGADFPLYKNLTYQYMIYNMRPECIPVDLVSTTLFRMFVMNSNEDRLLDNMIFRGKIMYLMSVFMPNEKPEDIMGYKPEQWKWCKKYEKQIWSAIIDQKFLFSTDFQLIRKFMNDAPFTSPISQESPGRLGTWIGWQIVASYMKTNDKVSLTELMDESDSQKILENSGYRP